MDKSELQKQLEQLEQLDQLEQLEQQMEQELELDQEQELELEQEQELQQRQQLLEQELQLVPPVQQHVMGVAADASQMASSSHYQTATMVTSGAHAVAMPSPMQPPIAFSNSPHHLANQQAQHDFHQQQQLQQQRQMLWANQMQELQQTCEFKTHSVPLTRIRKIMTADEDVRMISAEVPVIFAKACEMFVLDLTMRSWIYAEENKRRTLQKDDVDTAISRNPQVFDFLLPRDELIEQGLGTAQAPIPIPNYPIPPPPEHPVGSTGMIMGTSFDQATLYSTQQPRPPVAFMPWPHPQPQHRQPTQQPWPHPQPQQQQPLQQPWPYPQPQQQQPLQQPWPHQQPQQQQPPQQPWTLPQPQQQQPPQQPWPLPQPQQPQPPQQPWPYPQPQQPWPYPQHQPPPQQPWPHPQPQQQQPPQQPWPHAQPQQPQPPQQPESDP